MLPTTNSLCGEFYGVQMIRIALSELQSRLTIALKRRRISRDLTLQPS